MNYDYTNYIKNSVIRSAVDDRMAHPQNSIQVVQDDQGRTWFDPDDGHVFGTEENGTTPLLERIRTAVVLFFKCWSCPFRTNFDGAIQEINRANQNIINFEDSDNEDIQVVSVINSNYVTTEIPEKIIGKELLDKYLVDVGEVAPPPKELLEALEAPCPFSNNGNIKTKDSHVVMWVPKKIDKDKLTLKRLKAHINSDKWGANKIGFDKTYSSFPDRIADQETEGGYWLLMLKEPATHMAYAKVEEYVKNFENYDVPFTIEATLCAFLNYACSGEKQARILARENDVSLRYTWCKEGEKDFYQSWHMVVGSFSRSSGLLVSPESDGIGWIGVCPVRRFL